MIEPLQLMSGLVDSINQGSGISFKCLLTICQFPLSLRGLMRDRAVEDFEFKNKWVIEEKCEAIIRDSGGRGEGQNIQ